MSSRRTKRRGRAQHRARPRARLGDVRVVKHNLRRDRRDERSAELKRGLRHGAQEVGLPLRMRRGLWRCSCPRAGAPAGPHATWTCTHQTARNGSLGEMNKGGRGMSVGAMTLFVSWADAMSSWRGGRRWTGARHSPEKKLDFPLPFRPTTTLCPDLEDRRESCESTAP